MKKVSYLFSFALFIGSLFLTTCKKDEPNKPNITTLAPSSGHAGDVVVISGTFLGPTKKIKFGSLDGVVIDPKGGDVTTQVPANLPLGKVDVTVQTDGGLSNALSFTVTPPAPEITSINPVAGGPGMTVAITGKFFSTAKEVAFGATKVTTLDSKSETQVTLKVPDTLPLGATDVTVTTDGGTSNKISFTVLTKPTITDFTPQAGPAGTHVLITGTSFAETTDVLFLTVKSTFVIMSAALLDAVVPASAASGKLKVVTPRGEALSATDFFVKGAPVVTSFTPTSGTVGTEVTVTGQNFNIAGAKVKFGGIQALTLTVNSDTEIKVTVPAGAASGKITVETPAGTGFSSTDFTVVGGPTVTSFTPVTGQAGISVTINGTNFVNVTSVKFNGTEVGAANFTVNSSVKITAAVPAGSTSGTISVTSPSGTGSSSSNFTVIGLPTIASFTPSNGPVGAGITITGTGFTSVNSVKFNGVTATFTANSETQITAVVPATATTGTITVINVAGPGSSANSFTVILPPLISSISPTNRVTGSTLIITGSNLANATSVNFNATVVTTLISNTDSEIQVVVPGSLSAGAVNVSVVTAAGTSNTKTLTIIPAPVITDLKPNVSYKGFPIMIRGSNLSGTVGVKIGSTDATIMTVYDSTVIVTIPGTMFNGTYTVTVSNDGGPSNGLTLNISTAPGSVGTPPTGNFVSPPPPNYVNVVSNQWSLFLLSEHTTGCQLRDQNDATFCGKYTFKKDGTGKVISNYVVFTKGVIPETFYGQYSATVADPCTQKLFFISAKDGHVVTATVDVSGFSSLYPSGTCTP